MDATEPVVSGNKKAYSGRNFSLQNTKELPQKAGSPIATPSLPSLHTLMCRRC